MVKKLNHEQSRIKCVNNFFVWEFKEKNKAHFGNCIIEILQIVD